MDLSQFLSGNRPLKAFNLENYDAPSSDAFELVATIVGPGIIRQVSSYTSYRLNGGEGNVTGYIIVDGVQSDQFGSFQNSSNAIGVTDIHYTGPFTFRDSMEIYAKRTPGTNRGGGVRVEAFLY